MGGPGMGGPGMGGSGRGGGWGGQGTRRPRHEGPGMADPEMMGVAESLVIEHEGVKLNVRFPMKFEGKDEMEEFHLTTDGKPNQITLPGGIVMKSKTHWDKNRLITKSNSEGSGDSMEVKESRSLSEDGKMLTIAQYVKAGPMEAERTLVYEKESPDGGSQ